jgi:prepilin-type N-terminal cleavage/methylation domain-containing protein
MVVLFDRNRESQRMGSASRRGGGFTLIEILIVISIIALLSSFVLVAVTRGKREAAGAMAKTTVTSIDNALNQFVQDEAEYPGFESPADPERNDFPLLYNALFGERRPNGPGGRSAPYMSIKEDQVGVWDDDIQTYRKATRDERDDTKVEKFLLDPWGNPYVYRCNKGKRSEGWMHNRQHADIYSVGPNEIDDTAAESDEADDDDIGNW